MKRSGGEASGCGDEACKHFPEGEKSPLKDSWQGIDRIRSVFFCHLLKVYPGCNMEKRLKGLGEDLQAAAGEESGTPEGSGLGFRNPLAQCRHFELGSYYKFLFLPKVN